MGITSALWNAGKSRVTGLSQSIDEALFGTGVGLSALEKKVQSTHAYNGISKVYGKITGSTYAQQAVADIRSIGSSISNSNAAVAINNTINKASAGATEIAQGVVNNPHVQQGMAAIENGAEGVKGAMDDAFEKASAVASNGLEKGKGLMGQAYDYLPTRAIPVDTKSRQNRLRNVLVQDRGIPSKKADKLIQDSNAAGGYAYVGPMEAFHYRYMKEDGNYNLRKFGKEAGIAAGVAAGVGAAGYGATRYFGDD